MRFEDISFRDPQENLLYDERLWQRAEKEGDGEVLRFWESPVTFVVLGRAGEEETDVHLDRISEDDVPVFRRCSGGGTVVQGKGCLNYALVLSRETDARVADLHRSYQLILGKVIDAFKQLGVDAVFCPISDIALAGSLKKISGNAQRRGKRFILHHGTILYDFDLALITRYLKTPKDVPEYRRGREHADFVTNVPRPADAIKAALKNAFVSERSCCG